MKQLWTYVYFIFETAPWILQKQPKSLLQITNKGKDTQNENKNKAKNKRMRNLLQFIYCLKSNHEISIFNTILLF